MLVAPSGPLDEVRMNLALDRLEAEGVADDTIVIYYSDHGGILTRSKRFLYDTGVHIPMIVRFGKNFAHLAPEKAGVKLDRLVSQVDLAPTVLSLAGIAAPEQMQGIAFLGEHAGEPRDYVYCFRGRMDERYDFCRAVSDGQFKYIRNYHPHRIYGQHLNYLWKMPATNSWQAEFLAGRCNAEQSAFWQTKPVEELYDTQADPWEVKNLAADPAYGEVLERLRAANRAHLLKTRDSGFLPEAEMVAQAGNGTIYDLVRDNSRYPLEQIMAAAEAATDGSAGVDRLIEMLGAEHSAIRYWGATGCLILGEKAAPAKKALTTALEDSSADVRITAAEALIKLGETVRPLAVLTEELGSKQEYAALHAANSLEEIGEAARPALPALEAAATKGSEYVKRASEYTVEKLGKK